MLTLHKEQLIKMTRHKKKKSGSNLDKASLRNSVLGVFAKNPSQTYNYKQLAKQLLIRNSEERKIVLNSLTALRDEDYIEEMYPGKFKMKSWAWAALAAAMISSSLASGRPKAILSRMESEKRSEVWRTIPICRRS